MRYGVLSDVHGNAFALRAAVDRLTRVGVDGWLCAGDLVGYGPQPNECVALLAELGAIGVAGNHELLVLGRLPLDRAGRLARETTPWTRAALRADSRAYLAGLPLTVRLGELVMAHGSLDDPQRYVTAPDQARRELAALHRTDPAAPVRVAGSRPGRGPLLHRAVRRGGRPCRAARAGAARVGHPRAAGPAAGRAPPRAGAFSLRSSSHGGLSSTSMKRASIG